MTKTIKYNILGVEEYCMRIFGKHWQARLVARLVCVGLAFQWLGAHSGALGLWHAESGSSHPLGAALHAAIVLAAFWYGPRAATALSGRLDAAWRSLNARVEAYASARKGGG